MGSLHDSGAVSRIPGVDSARMGQSCHHLQLLEFIKSLISVIKRNVGILVEFVFLNWKYFNLIQEFGIGISARKISMSYGMEILVDRIMLLHMIVGSMKLLLANHMARFIATNSSHGILYFKIVVLFPNI